MNRVLTEEQKRYIPQRRESTKSGQIYQDRKLSSEKFGYKVVTPAIRDRRTPFLTESFEMSGPSIPGAGSCRSPWEASIMAPKGQ